MKINKTNEIELLDCTLRDGGHITGSYFGKEVIYDIAQKMIQSKIDILEAGFLKDCTKHISYYHHGSFCSMPAPSTSGPGR